MDGDGKLLRDILVDFVPISLFAAVTDNRLTIGGLSVRKVSLNDICLPVYLRIYVQSTFFCECTLWLMYCI